jgi:hypothetical protein
MRGALYEAVTASNVAYLRFLLDRGFDPRILDIESSLIFYAAALWPHHKAEAMLKILLVERGLDIHATDGVGCTPLHRAVCRHSFHGYTLVAWGRTRTL